jgi:hypothetical protein
VSPEDELLKRSLDEKRRLQESITYSPIQRKPLPNVPFANYPPSERPPPPPKSYPHYQPSLNGNTSDTQNGRYIARGVHLRLGTSEGNGVRRKPVGPRAFNSNQKLEDIGNVNGKTVESSTDEALDWQKMIPALLGEPPPTLTNDLRVYHSLQDEIMSLSTLTIATDMAAAQQQDGLQDRFKNNLQDDHSCNGSLGGSTTEITLIRRDASSSSQWNIGTILFPTATDEATDYRLDKFVTVELSTPGYQKFARQVSGIELGAKTFKSAHEIKDFLNSETASSPVDVMSSTPTGNIFTRQIQWEITPDQVEEPRQRTTSEDTITSLRPNFNATQRSRIRPKLAFKSPWQGCCTFSTGMDGRSLKCRHRLSNRTSGEKNLSADVAELRFNLPWLMPKTKQDRSQERPRLNARLWPTGHGSKESFKRGLRHLKSWNSSSSDREGDWSERYSQPSEVDSASDSDDRMDLTLGRENAGGGFKGRSAKLGKLIIYDEGLKMCDLLVGACMGIWWQQYTGRIDDQ